MERDIVFTPSEKCPLQTCPYGHSYIIKYYNCPICSLEKRLAEKKKYVIVDKHVVYKDKNLTKLRVKCTKQFCGIEFYATEQQLLLKNPYIYLCKQKHSWWGKNETLRTIRVFELLFNRRFDDPHQKYNLTCHNAALKIAVIHGGDTTAVNADTIEEMNTYFINHDYTFIYIQKHRYHVPEILADIYDNHRGLLHLGINVTKGDFIVQMVDMMKKLSDDGKYLPEKMN